jgi:hypothetical protein
MEAMVPESIQKQFEQAQQIQSQVYKTDAPAPVEASTANTEAPVKQDAEPVIPVAELEPKPAVTQTFDDFKHKYEVIDGKYKAEVPRLHQQLREREVKLREMEAELEKAKKPPETKTEPTALITEKDVEDFGSDLVSMARRAAKEVIQADIQSILSEVDKRLSFIMGQMGTIQSQVVQSESDKFWSRVEMSVPDWKTVDTDPQWIEFLNTTPDFTTKTYRELAAEAIQAGDHSKIVNLVKKWRPEDTPNNLPAPKPARTVHPDLQRQVAPSTARSTVTPQTAKIWSASEYEQVFNPAATRGMPEKQLAAMQLDAQQALAEGRVRW